MRRHMGLSFLSVLLIFGALAVSMLGSRFLKYSYEATIFLSLAAFCSFMLSAFLKKGAPSPSGRPALKSAGEREAKGAPHITFSDVAANDNARKSLMELADFLKSPEKYASLGARIPHGVLLYGPPGTGKTLLAKALAGESNVPFIAMNGSDFVEMYVGVGASRVREVFRRARKHKKCVIFIDEIDSLGRNRGANSSEERDQTLNALLSEMSGFHPSDGVIVVAATNRMEMLDEALLRPGRFDRQIEVGLPGREERESILRLHAKTKPLAKDVSLQTIAASTAFFSGASLENLLNEAAIRTARRGGSAIEQKDIEEAFISVTAGEDGRAHDHALSKAQIALHEAGHAIVSRVLLPENKICRVSILPSSNGAAGYNLTLPEEKALYTRRELEAKIAVLLAGRAAEALAFGEDGITSGASGDIRRAAELAGKMLSEFGMGGQPAVCEAALTRVFGANGAVREKAKSLLNAIYEETLRILRDKLEALTHLSKELMANEHLNEAELDRIFEGYDLRLSNDFQASTNNDQ